MSHPLVFIHGAFCGGWAFDAFRRPFTAAGFETHAPDLPHHAPGADPGALARTGVRDYARAVAEYCRRLTRPPVLIGHSLGGLVAQLAATHMRTEALVLLAPTAPWGVLPTTLDEHGGNLGLLMMGDYWRRPVAPDYAVARHVTLDRLDGATARHTFQRFVPESGRAVLEALQWWRDPTASSAAPAYRIDAPVLAIAGGRDRVNPSTTVRRIVNRFPTRQAAFHEFADMSHWLIGEPGWEDAATLAMAWLKARGVAPRAGGIAD